MRLGMCFPDGVPERLGLLVLKRSGLGLLRRQPAGGGGGVATAGIPSGSGSSQAAVDPRLGSNAHPSLRAR